LIWNKFREGIQYLGWSNGLLYMTSRAMEALSRGAARIIKYRFVAQPVPNHMLAPASDASSTEIYCIAAADPLVQRFPRPKHVVAKRFADGAICFVAVKADTLVGFIWIKQNSYMEDEVRCLYVLDPPGAAAWDFDVWVAPEYRLTRAFARLWDTANAFLREQGYRWSISRISAFNPGSLAAHRRLGLTHLHTGLFLLLGPVQLAVLSCAPYVHLSTSPRRYPVLRLRVPEVGALEPAVTRPASR
jgi:hypothetical protein